MADRAPVAVGRRPRRRHRGAGLLVAVVVVVGLAVAADRVALVLAERAVADRLGGQPPFTTKPDVSAHGFPFLTQAVGGRYRDVEVRGRGLTLGTLHGVGFDADLRGVHVPLRAALQGTVDRIPIDTVDGTVVIPYAEFARLTGVRGLQVTESGGALTVTAPVTVFGRTFDVVADGRVGLSGRDLDLTVANIRVAGVSLPGAVVGVASDLLNAAVRLPELPYGLALRSVDTAGDGLHVTAHGAHVTVTASGTAAPTPPRR